MKYYVQNLAMLSAVIAFGCQSNKSEPVNNDESRTQTVAAEESNPKADANTADSKETKTIEGTVKSIDRGKDGYTAMIETKGDGIYAATISRANLKDPKQYRDFNQNEIVKLTGDSWKMGEDIRLTVREIN